MSARDRMAAACLRAGVRVAGWLPWNGVRLLARVTGGAARLLPSRLRRTATDNLRLVFPERSDADIRRLADEALQHCLYTAVEAGPLAHWPAPRILERIRQVRGAKLLAPPPAGGVLLVLPHLGNWELAGLYAGLQQAAPLHALYRPPRIATLDAWLRARRERFGVRLLPLDAAGMRRAWRELRRGGTLAVLPDQDPGRRRASEVLPFFGIPTRSSTLAARLSAKAGRTVIGCATRREDGDGFSLEFAELTFPAGAGVRERAVVIHQAIETATGPVLAQYQWCYDRWRQQRLPRNTAASGAAVRT